MASILIDISHGTHASLLAIWTVFYANINQNQYKYYLYDKNTLLLGPISIRILFCYVRMHNFSL